MPMSCRVEWIDITPYIRCALWGNKPEKNPNANWTTVMKVAKEQAVFGLVFYGAEGMMASQLAQQQVFEWIGVAEQIRRQNLMMNEELVGFDRAMRAWGIDYRVVKGHVAASCYPEPLLRQPGDIDLYCTVEYYQRFNELLSNRGTKIRHGASEKHVEFERHGLLYELHWTLNNFSKARWQTYFDKILSEDKGMTVNVGGTEIPTLSPTMNALYIFIHLFHHLIHSGVGLRQLCDWMMWLHRYKDEIDKDELLRHLKAMELERPYRVLGAILVEHLGLPEREFPLTITGKDRTRSRRIIADIMRMGNFGHNIHKADKLGFVHSLQTGWQMVCQSAKYVDLAPKEILGHVPYMVAWWMKKKFK